MGFYLRNANVIGKNISSATVNNFFLIGKKSFLTFTNAGTVGPVGPTLAACQTAYSSFLSDLNFYNFTVNNGYQSFTIPDTGVYRFTLNGASGGVWTTNPMNPTMAALAPTIDGFKRIPGARVVGTYSLTQGQVITIVVGQGGGDDNDTVANCPGGGGGTFVTLGSYANILSGVDNLLFAAGGGGGSGFQSADTAPDNYTAAIGQSTTSGGTTASNPGGTGGNGAGTGASSDSSGGAGYFTGPGNSTTSDFSYNVPNDNPRGFRLGAKGGSFTGTSRGFGGFGGGGSGPATATSDDDKGGGGGYSGGGFAYDAARAGGGGGSYADALASNVVITAGGNTTGRHGSVLIELVG